ncbi:hypothetical protein SESBI_47222 [Sesbania bispinosa]|nr:hypothetical protein SESBI_47222 [Sesbania bispinosa]
MKELSILCGIPTCSVISGPGDTEPKIWPSLEVAKQLLQRLEEVPKGVKSRKVVTQLSFMRDKTKKLEYQLAKLKERNNEKDMSILMHQIHHDGKSLSDFEPTDLKCSLGYVEQKLNKVRMRIKHFKQVVPPNPPPQPPQVSCPKVNEVLEKQPSLDLLKETDQVNSGFDNDNNVGSSSMGLPPPHANLSDVDMVFPQENFGGFTNVSDLGVFPPSNFGDLIGESDLRSDVFSLSDFRGLIGESDSGLGAFPLENFGNLNGESNHLGSEVLPPQGNFEGLIGENDLWLLPQGNFEGLNGESDEGNYEGLNVGSDSGVLPQGNFGGLNGESDEGNYGGLNVGSDSRVLPQGNFGGPDGESDEGYYEGLNVGSDSGVLP